jgi:hypothetical protein
VEEERKAGKGMEREKGSPGVGRAERSGEAVLESCGDFGV